MSRKYKDDLERFVHEGICGEQHKRSLRSAKLIEYHGFWHLSDKGKAEAVRQGYLQEYVQAEEGEK